MAFEIHGKLFFDASDLDRLPEKAREVEHHLKDAFKRTGDIRAGAAIEGFIQNLTSGNVVGAVESIARRISGLGLLGGVAFGTLTYGLNKFVENIKASQEAFGEFQKVMQSPVMTTTFKELAEQSEKMLKFSGILGFFTREQQGDTAVRGDIAAKQHQLEITERWVNMAGQQIAHQRDLSELAVREASGIKSSTDALKQRIELETKLMDIQKQAVEMRADVKKEEEKGLPKEQVTARQNAITNWVVGQQQLAEETAGRVPMAKFAGRMFARAGVTFDELLEAGREAPNVGLQFRHRQSIPVMLQGDAYLAKIAQGQEAEGERLRKLGFRKEAAMYFGEAQGLRARMTSLREDEKPEETDLAKSIDTAEVFQKMVGFLETIANNVKNPDYANK